MNYSTSDMPKHEMSLSVSLVYSSSAFGFYVLHQNTALKFNHVFQQHWLPFIISSEFTIHTQRHTSLKLILIMHLGDFMQVMTHLYQLEQVQTLRKSISQKPLYDETKLLMKCGHSTKRFYASE